ncbi:MAG: class I SAM-dependent methyltransferase [Haloarculaceae archaeon]
MDVPETVKTALADRPVEGAVCLDAGAGVGNTTAGLLDAGARRVYAVTNDREHAATVREGVGREHGERVLVTEADLRATPLPDDSVDVIAAHALLNVVTTSALSEVAAELTRVAAPGAHLVVDDYDPVPGDAAVRDLFAVENAAAALARGEPALTFYPAAMGRHLFAGYGWSFERERTLLSPVPWTESHVAAHADAAREAAATLPPELGDPLRAETDRLADAIGSESAGRMYSLAFRRPEQEPR